MSSLTIWLLGPPRIECEDTSIEIGRRKAVALLVYLAMTRQSYHRDELATLLWPTSNQSRARGNLRHVLSELNQALGPSWLDREGETVGLNQDFELWLDVAHFRHQLAACQSHDHPADEVCPACLPLLAEAVALYCNDFLAGFTLRNSPEFDEWQFFQAESLRQELATALERLVRGHRAQEQFEPAIEYARRWLALDPLHEPVQRQLMLLYAQVGQRAAALRQYAACERLLEAELGLLPEEETVRVYEAIKEKRVLPASTGKVTPSRRKPSSQRQEVTVASRPDRFRIERKLGEGGMGEVWLATDTVLDRQVALKRPGISPSASGAEQLLQEARLLASLNHPNITAIHDFFIDQGESNFYLVLEYVDGKDLSEIIRTDTPLSLDIVLEITDGILRALSYAHGQGVVHRDVKPANVMIGDDVKLTDFGLANLAALLEPGTGLMAGTPAYMAPEQIEGRPTDGRADLYSLGVTLFELLSGGQLPFDYADEDELMAAHLHTAPPPLSQFVPDIPPLLEQIILRLLAKDPGERYPSAEAVLDALGEIHVGPELGNLPVLLTPFIGREAELAEIQEQLQDLTCRLLTLIGPGGSGKTRLALETAAAQFDNYAQGVFFVSLAPLDSVDSIVPTMAEALGFRFYDEGEPQQQLLDYLRQKNLLLIMDNFEHLLTPAEEKMNGGAALVVEMLRAVPGLKILTTSRTRLNVKGEHLFSVAGMDFPDEETIEDVAQYSAIQLFLQSARRTQPNFDLTTINLADVVQVCRLVEGMPLAILLAAAWVEMLTPAEIVAEVKQSIDFLETDWGDVPERQRSLRAVFDHSWRLLTEREREVFQGLSVFRGGFTHQVAQQVTGTSLQELMTLVNKSLLHRIPTGRFEVHKLLRQYAAEKLDQSLATSQAVHDLHSAYFAAALQEWAVDLKGAQRKVALTEMDVEIENARAAWNWAVEQRQVEKLDQAIEGLGLFYDWRGRRQEGEAVCRAGAEKLTATASDDELRVLAKILTWQGALVEYAEGRTHLEQGLALLGHSVPTTKISLVTNLFGQIFQQVLYRLWPSWSSGRLATMKAALLEAARAYERLTAVYYFANETMLSLCAAFRSLNLAEAAGPSPELARGYASVGVIIGFIPLSRVAEAYCQRALEASQNVEDVSAQMWVSLVTGSYYAGVGYWAKARKLLGQVIEISEYAEDRSRWNDGVGNLAVVTYLQGEFAASIKLSDDFYTSASHRNDSHNQGWALRGKVYCLLPQGKFTEALACLEELQFLLTKDTRIMDEALEIDLYGLLALAHLRRNKPHLALAAADEATRLMAGTYPTSYLSLPGYAGVAETYITLCEANNPKSNARRASKALCGYARVFPIGQPRAYLWQGVFQWLSERSNSAQKLWAKSLATAEEMAMPYDQGLTHYEIGQHLSLDDPARSKHLTQACDIFDRLEATFDLERAQEALRLFE